MFNDTLMLIFMIVITLDINKLYKNGKKQSQSESILRCDRVVAICKSLSLEIICDSETEAGIRNPIPLHFPERIAVRKCPEVICSSLFCVRSDLGLCELFNFLSSKVH